MKPIVNRVEVTYGKGAGWVVVFICIVASAKHVVVSFSSKGICMVESRL